MTKRGGHNQKGSGATYPYYFHILCRNRWEKYENNNGNVVSCRVLACCGCMVDAASRLGRCLQPPSLILLAASACSMATKSGTRWTQMSTGSLRQATSSFPPWHPHCAHCQWWKMWMSTWKKPGASRSVDTWKEGWHTHTHTQNKKKQTNTDTDLYL